METKGWRAGRGQATAVLVLVAAAAGAGCESRQERELRGVLAFARHKLTSPDQGAQMWREQNLAVVDSLAVVDFLIAGSGSARPIFAEVAPERADWCLVVQRTERPDTVQLLGFGSDPKKPLFSESVTVPPRVPPGAPR